MPRKARIRIWGTDSKQVDDLASEIVGIAKKLGVKVSGPIPLPRKRLLVTVRRAPSGQGYHTFDHWEMRIYKRLIDMDADERAIRQLMRMRVPENIKIEIELVD
ncbi:MAG: 30S ribosomal protein S10 [Vulcanisaeta sp.]|jgi:small subunit ribosomal protein S10|uniref:Small ribosomal subunit protein uS10 n=1 Tax=Vulcanisaeta moutnovskia (strain 768-28) TaxID=985053 RepID=F0QTP1_VULM7|nr:30S ribosomal protein S10 [Vulcanisaeta moutnovskia]ADY01754.1 30S ribosomal protein S10 [Vulcanisaeta moutnovskia 768-28]